LKRAEANDDAGICRPRLRTTEKTKKTTRNKKTNGAKPFVFEAPRGGVEPPTPGFAAPVSERPKKQKNDKK